MAESKGRKIFDGRYEIVSIVGRGACSVVYHARHAMAPATEVALKVLLNKQSDKVKVGDRLRKEALAMVSCRHRFVVRLDDFHTVGEVSYLSMEFAPHSDLRKFAAKSGGKLSARLGELFLLQSAEALGFIHKAGVIHRDIKPDNILVISEKECRLADFGVAVLPGEESSLEELRAGVGTMAYMAPEVLEGTGYDQRSDVYALGVTFYELFTGKHPFAGASLAQQIEARRDGAIPSPAAVNPEIPDYLSNAIMQALQFDPARRFPTGKEFQQTILVNRAQMKLEPTAESGKPAAPKAPPSKETPTAPRARTRTEPSIGLTGQVKAAAETPLRTPSPTPAAPEPRTPAAAPVSTPIAAAGPAPQMAANAGPIPAAQPEMQPPPVQRAPSALAALALAGGEERTAGSPSNSAPRPSRPRENHDILGQSRKNAPEPPRRENNTVKERSPTPEKKRPEPQAPSHERRSSLSHKDPRKSTLMAVSIAVFLVILMYGNIFIKKRYNIDIAKTIIEAAIGAPDPTAPFIPEYKAAEPVFPVLPPGVYAGTISGLVPAATVPLSIMSFSEQGFLVFIPGVEGWTPTMVSLNDLPAEGPAIVRVTSNGIVLDLSGQTVDGEIVGYFKNVLSGAEGEWRVRPVQK